MKRTVLTVLGTFALAGAAYACSSDDGGGSSSGATPDSGASSTSTSSSSSSSGSDASTSSTSTSSGGDGGDGGGSSGKPNPIEGAVTSDALCAGAGCVVSVAADGLQWKAGSPSLLLFTQPIVDDIVSANLALLPADPTNEVKSPPAGTPVGLALDKAKALIGCETKPTGRVVRYDAAYTATLIADNASGVAFDAPNDMVVRKSDGLIYVTDPGYGVATPNKNRIYKITNAGVATVVDDFATVDRPNGIALSPDSVTLYVSVTEPTVGAPFIRKYTVLLNGDVTKPGTNFVSLPVGSTPDGMTTDDDGNVFVATKSGIDVFKPDGSKWGTISVIGGATNVRHGGADRKTLFIAQTNTALLKATVKVAGRAD